MPSEVIDEGYEVTASSDAHVPCWSPHVRMDQIEPVPAPIHEVLCDYWDMQDVHKLFLLSNMV